MYLVILCKHVRVFDCVITKTEYVMIPSIDDEEALKKRLQYYLDNDWKYINLYKDVQYPDNDDIEKVYKLFRK